MLRRYHVISVACVLLAAASGIVMSVSAQQPQANQRPSSVLETIRHGLFGPPPHSQGQGQAPGQSQSTYRQGQYRRPYQQGQYQQQQHNPQYNPQYNPQHGRQYNPQHNQQYQPGHRQPAEGPSLSERVRSFVGEPIHHGQQGQNAKKPHPQARQPSRPAPEKQGARIADAPPRNNPPSKSRRATGDRVVPREREAPQEAETEVEEERPVQAVPRRQTEERAIVLDSGTTSSRRTRSAQEYEAPGAVEVEPLETQPSHRERSAKPASAKPAIEPPQLTSPQEVRAPVALDPIASRIGHLPEERAAPPQERTPPNENVLFRRHGAALVVETLGPRRIILDKEATYRVVLRNLSDVAEGNAHVAIHMPGYAELIAATPSRGKVQVPSKEKPSEGVHWQVQSLRAGGQEELVLKIIPRDSRPLDLAVSVQSASVDSQFSVDVREPKLQLNIVGPREVNFGEKAIYELTFANPGTADAEDVLVRLLPIDASDEADTHEIGTIQAGSKQTVEIELVARQPGTLVIQAEATAEGGVKTDARREVIVLKPELRVVVEGPKFRYARTVATYSIRVTNPGNALARNVQLGAMLPVQATFVSASGGGAPKADESNQIVWKVDDIQAGGEQVFELKCELEKAGPNRVQVAVLGDNDLGDKNFAATEVEALADLDLEVHDPKGPMPVGEEIPYEVIVANRGGKSADNIQVFAFFSEGVEAVQVIGHRHQIEPGKVVLDPITKLGAGEQVTVKIIAKAEKAGTHMFRAEVHCPSLSVKLSEQETTRFYGEDQEREDRKGSPAAEKEKAEPLPQGPVVGPADKEPPKVTPSHPKPLDSGKPPLIPAPGPTNGKQ